MSVRPSQPGTVHGVFIHVFSYTYFHTRVFITRSYRRNRPKNVCTLYTTKHRRGLNYYYTFVFYCTAIATDVHSTGPERRHRSRPIANISDSCRKKTYTRFVKRTRPVDEHAMRKTINVHWRMFVWCFEMESNQNRSNVKAPETNGVVDF